MLVVLHLLGCIVTANRPVHDHDYDLLYDASALFYHGDMSYLHPA